VTQRSGHLYDFLSVNVCAVRKEKCHS